MRADTEPWVALNADVVGYSALVADDVQETTEAMTEVHREVSAIVAENGGTLANFVGDSFMAVFRDAMAALKAARAIAAALEARNAGRPKKRHVRLRMGMDQGPVTFADGNHHGDALNIAARIQAIARPGGLAVSGRVYQALDEPALRFRPLGKKALKNIPERITVYDFLELPVDGGSAPIRPALHLEAPSLAVLPIHTVQVDEQVRSLADLIRHDLLHRLSTIPELTVIDAPSEPTGNAGSTARYMVETGVHQFGKNVRLYATLFDISTMNVVKSHKWSAVVDDLFDLSEAVANEVARSVEVDLVVGEPAHLYADLDDPDAIEKVYLGWYHLRYDTPEGWQRAMELFAEVAETHPESPYGHVLLAFCWWLGAANKWASNPEEAFDRAVALARVGEEVGDPTGMAQTVVAAVLMSRGEMDRARAMVDDLAIVRPTCDITFALAGSIRRYLGQWEQAVELLDVAMRLTGINKPWYPTVKACSLFVGERFEDAASLAEGVLEYQPRNLEALLVLAAAQQEMGLDRRAHATSKLIQERFPTLDVEDWLEQNPYRRREIIERWKGALVAAGALGGT